MDARRSLVLASRDAVCLKKKNGRLVPPPLKSLVQNLVHDEFRRRITEVYDMK